VVAVVAVVAVARKGGKEIDGEGTTVALKEDRPCPQT
jgi:hypothetical protein